MKGRRLSEQQSNPQPKWCWWSTRGSIDNDVLSVMAVVETVVAVAGYWIAALYFDIWLPMTISLLVAPLVLLRSEESVTLGVRWFLAWQARAWDDDRAYAALSSPERLWVWLIGGAATLLGVAFAYGASVQFLAEAVGWQAFLDGMLVGYGAMVVAGAAAAAAAGAIALIVFIPFVIGMGVSVWLVSLAIRMAATSCHIVAGFRLLPRNFRRLVLCTSP